ncbi:uncharacterized protein LOC108103758 [Drosophila eugracilis]|uniref:uncharacterized protein LOC108103758 n=1 Tax=Drosophila eugracilis TaxID=29029 RepID=UPI0007E63BDA|nr:uncharacterized protein LOC108103758 [Drosophila eugracilis]
MSGLDREQVRLFVADSRRRLNALLLRLNWSEQGVRGAGDQIPQDKADESTEMLEQLPASCCTNPAFSIQLEDKDIQQIIGGDEGQPSATASSFDDLQAGLDTQEKLLIYEHVLKHTKKHPEFEDNAAFAELVGETKREWKKQRRYRKSKPTLNEELQHLVSLQMEALQRQWPQKQKERPTEQGNSRKRRRSRSSSSEKHRHRYKRRFD